MKINDVMRIEQAFKQIKQDGKIDKKIAEKIEDYSVIQQLLGKPKGKKGKNQTLATNQTSPAYNLSLSGPRTPMWDVFWTKREPIMSDEEFEKEITALALEFAEKSMEIGNSGKGTDMINSMLDKLRNEYNDKKANLELHYVSVVSPDRKAAYAKADFTKAPIVYGNEPSILGGNELMLWGPSGWSTIPTIAERERSWEFSKIYGKALTAYEKEHGQIPYTTISRAVAPPRNYL
jgi:hypothetical protein